MKYRKKPVEIEAIRFVYSTLGIKDLENFCGSALRGLSKERHPEAIGQAMLETLEGPMIAIELDYIIKGVKGEIYACKPDIFEMTYEEIV